MAVVNTNLQLVISICTSANKKQLIISEATGAYNALSNPTGWAPTVTATNPATGDVTSVQLVITNPSGTSKTYTLGGPNDITGIFPDSTGQNVLLLDNSDFGGSASSALVDGEYSISYTTDGNFTGGNTFSAKTSARLYNANSLECCRDKLFAAAGSCDGCRDEKLALALEVDGYIKAAEYATLCGQSGDKPRKFLAKALWICNTHNCSNCS